MPPLPVMDHIRSRKPFSAQDLFRPDMPVCSALRREGLFPGRDVPAARCHHGAGKNGGDRRLRSFLSRCRSLRCSGRCCLRRFCHAHAQGLCRSCLHYDVRRDHVDLCGSQHRPCPGEFQRPRRYARMSGIISTAGMFRTRERRVSALAAELHSELAGTLSRSPLVLKAEEEGQCLLQAYPESEMAQEYKRLADAIAAKTLAGSGA